MPKTTTYAELYCYGDLLTSGYWGGVMLSDLINQTQISSEIASIEFFASDGYRVNIPIDLAMQPQIIIAFDKDDQLLNEGYRLILPEFNGANWIAQITKIALSALEVKYPDVVSAGSSSVSNQLPTTIYPTPTPTPQYIQEPTITPQPTTQSKPGILEPTPTIGAASTQPTPKTETAQEINPDQNLVLYILIFALVIILVSTGSLIYYYKHKINP